MSAVLLPPGVQPPPQRAELIIRAWGENKPEAARAILELCERPRRDLVNVEVRPPFRMLLPGPLYDRDHPLVQALKATGCTFSIVCYPWVCPFEDADDGHMCRPTCSVMQLREEVTP